jgi:hypothetical protein
MISRHSLPTLIMRIGVIYLGSMWIAAITYMLRHREELRDPPEERERQTQRALKNGSTILNLFLALFVITDIASVFQLRSGRLDARHAAITSIELIASAPAILILLWIQHRLRTRKLARSKD